jgi:hypothetical protein
MKKTRYLRRLINDPRICILIPERMGYRVTAWQGPAHSRRGLGVTCLPDAWPEMNVKVTAGSDLCANEAGLWIARLDIADGPPMRVYDSLCAIEKAGVAGMVLENVPSNPEGAPDRIADEALARMEAIARSRWDPDFVLAVRVGPPREYGYSTLLRKLNDCVDAGADLLIVAGAIPSDDLRKLVCGVSRPLCVDLSLSRQYLPARSAPLLSALQESGAAAAVMPSARARRRRNPFALAVDLPLPNTADLRIRNHRGGGVTHAVHRTWSTVGS